MLIPTPTHPAILTPLSGGTETQAWRTGQILKAVVQSVNRQEGAQPPVGIRQEGAQLPVGIRHEGAQLLIGNRQVTVQSQIPLKPGQELLIRITGSAAKPQFQLISPPTTTPRLVEALRTAIPKQQPLAPMLANLQHLGATSGNMRTLGEALFNAARQVRQQISHPQQLSQPQGVRQAVEKSGIFLEVQLREGTRPGTKSPTTDLKGALLQLYQRLIAPQSGQRPYTPTSQPAPTPPPLKSAAPQSQPPARPAANLPLEQLRLLLIQQTEGVLSRIQLNQLASLPTDEGGRNQLTLEIPIHGNNHEVRTLQLIIEREAGAAGTEQEENQRWSVTLAMELEGLGPVYARISVMGDEVNTTLFAEQAQTVQQFEQQIDILKQGLSRAGLSVAQLTCRQGRPSMTPNTPYPNLVSQRV